MSIGDILARATHFGHKTVYQVNIKMEKVLSLSNPYVIYAQIEGGWKWVKFLLFFSPLFLSVLVGGDDGASKLEVFYIFLVGVCLFR